MRKVILNFCELTSGESVSRREFHEYIAGKMGFPDYYGHNLDALYDCLTDICEPTAIGIAMPEDMDEELEEHDGGGQDRHRMLGYLAKIRHTFEDAEMSNPNLAVLNLNEAKRNC